MIDIKDGGSAFPVCGVDGVWDVGMTLRDWFAGQVIGELCRQLHLNMCFDPKSITERAYQIADAMIAAREGK